MTFETNKWTKRRRATDQHSNVERRARSNTETFDIKHMSDEFDVTYRALRLYEQKGVLKPIRIGNQRLFTHEDRWRLAYLLRAKRMGFSIREARELIEWHDGGADDTLQLETVIGLCEKNLERLLAQRDAIDAAYEQLIEYMQSARAVIASRSED